MYLEHFGLSAFPFTTAPDPRFYYPTAKHKEALACLLYAVEQKKGFSLVTGDIGAGKTMLCRAALERLGDRVTAGLIVHTSLTPLEFLQAVGSAFALDTDGKGKVALLRDLEGFLLGCKKEGRSAVLIVDEAQDLSRDVLEEIRLLGNLETSTEKLLQVVLVGQPELRCIIESDELRPLNQRIALKFHLGTLAGEEVGSYIDHRLRVAGAPESGIFDPEAKAEVFRASGGVPRLVNIICDQALLQAYVSDERHVLPDTVRSAVAEMEGNYMEREPQTAAGVPTEPQHAPAVAVDSCETADVQREEEPPSPAAEISESPPEGYRSRAPRPPSSRLARKPRRARLRVEKRAQPELPHAAAAGPELLDTKPASLRASAAARPPSARSARRPRRPRLESPARTAPETRPERADEPRPVPTKPPELPAPAAAIGERSSPEAADQFESVDDLCRAMEGGRVPMEFALSAASMEVASYRVNGLEVSVRFARRGSENYALLICGVGHSRDPKAEQALSGLAANMGYVRADSGAYLRQDGGAVCTLKFSPAKIGMASSSPDGFSHEAFAGRVRKMHDELAGFISALAERSSGRASGRTLQKAREAARRAQLACPECGMTVGVYEDEAGEWGKCPSCSAQIRIPDDAFVGSNARVDDAGAEVPHTVA
jgi:type II secretory pathway predicted ATPase ExeA